MDNNNLLNVLKETAHRREKKKNTNMKCNQEILSNIDDKNIKGIDDKQEKKENVKSLTDKQYYEPTHKNQDDICTKITGSNASVQDGSEPCSEQVPENNLNTEYEEYKQFIDQKLLLQRDVPINSDLLCKIRGFMKNFEKKPDYDAEYDDSCCICYTKYDSINPVYISCFHKLCNTCYEKLPLNPIEVVQHKIFRGKKYTMKVNTHKKLCPMCRRLIDQIILNKNNKYVALCLGDATDKHTYENGGYLGAYLLLFPGEQQLSYPNITYHNNEKNVFETQIVDLFNQNYTIVVQDYSDVCKWLKEMYLSDLLDMYEMDNRLMAF